jgi:uncharacterized membrane protein YagU involved in acid resistance
LNSLLSGSLAGLAATVPMTAAMVALHKQLPRHEQYPLPPREVTVQVAEKAGVVDDLETEAEVRQATWAAHFAFGAAAGALYGPLARHMPGGRVAGGVLFGLAVWSGSYVGWLPALGIRRSATRQPPRREGLMIAAHIVWGAALGLLTSKLSGNPR